MAEVVVKDQELQKAAMEGMDEFIDVFVKAIYDASRNVEGPKRAVGK